MKPLLRVISLIFLVGLAAHAMSGQEFVKEKDLAEAARDLDSAPAKSHLPCNFDLQSEPYLDLLYRYSAAFQIDCQLGTTVQPGTTWMAVIRVTNQFGKSAVMLEEFDIPQVQHENRNRFDAHVSRLKVTMSGGFATGPGRFLVEIVLTDEHGDSIGKKWKVKFPGYKEEQHIPSALLPGEVAPLLDPHWDGALTSRGVRVIVLLNVEGFLPFVRFNATDRTYLLQFLASSLNQLPCRSVKLIAFDPEKQEELFRQDNFDAEGFVRLGKILGQVQIDTVPYQALIKGAEASFLVEMVQREVAPKQAPDAVIFLSISGMPMEKLSGELLNNLEAHDTHVYYLRHLMNLANQDALEDVTRKLHGNVITFYSPVALARAITRISTEMKVAPSAADSPTSTAESSEVH
jgi:hypothetical protein